MTPRQDEDLVALVRHIARLCRQPYRSLHRLRHAHLALRLYADEHGLPEWWCDRVLLEFMDPPWARRHYR